MLFSKPARKELIFSACALLNRHTYKSKLACLDTSRDFNAELLTAHLYYNFSFNSLAENYNPPVTAKYWSVMKNVLEILFYSGGLQMLLAESNIRMINQVTPKSHRITEWLGLEVTSGDPWLQSPCSRDQDHLELVVQDCTEEGFKNVQGKRMCHSHNKEVFLIFRRNLLYFPLCLLPLVLLLGTTKKPGSILLTPPFRYLHIFIKSPLHLPQAKQVRVPQSPPKRCSSLLVIFGAVMLEL